MPARPPARWPGGPSSSSEPLRWGMRLNSGALLAAAAAALTSAPAKRSRPHANCACQPPEATLVSPPLRPAADGHYERATFPGWLRKAAAVLMDIVVLGLQAATFRVVRVEACDPALSQLGFQLSVGDIHTAASRLCMPVMAGLSPPAQALLLRAMPELQKVKPRERPFGLPVASPGTHLMPTITPDKVLEAEVRRSGGGTWACGLASGAQLGTCACALHQRCRALPCRPAGLGRRPAEPGDGHRRHRSRCHAAVRAQRQRGPQRQGVLRRSRRRSSRCSASGRPTARARAGTLHCLTSQPFAPRRCLT